MAELLGVPVTGGFWFSPKVFARLAGLRPQRSQLVVNVRIAGTQVLLRGSKAMPTVAQLVELWRNALLSNQVRPQQPVIGKADQQRARLSRLRLESEPFRELPLRPIASRG